MTKKKPKFGALPTINMPRRTHDKASTARPSRSIVCDKPLQNTPKKFYKNFEELCKRVKLLKGLKEWKVKEMNDRLMNSVSVACMVPQLEVIIDDSLGYTIPVCGWRLPEDRELYLAI